MAADGQLEAPKPRLAVFKFASCDGCQLSLLDCEDELLALASAIDIVNFPEASRQMLPGPYDIALVEGSITTPHDRQRIHEVRANTRFLISIGACATAGGIQALRNYADVDEYVRTVYAHPEYISTLKTATPIAAHVNVDYELHGCPINKHQLIEVLLAFAAGRRPQVVADSVCMECKARGTTCILVTRGEACLGPVTHAGCGAICPAYQRACYGCYGSKDAPNVAALANWLHEQQGRGAKELTDALRSFNPEAPALKDAVGRWSSGEAAEE